MAVEVTGSKYTCKINYLIAVACVAAALYCIYDGWINKKFQEKYTLEDGTPDVTLQINRYWLPIICGVAMVYLVVTSVRLRSKNITADEEGLVLSTGKKIPYKNIKQIDKRYFEKKGHFTIEHEEQGRKEKLKLTDRHWDGLGALLDEIVKQTGAKPAGLLEKDTKPQDQPSAAPDQSVETSEDNEADN